MRCRLISFLNLTFLAALASWRFKILLRVRTLSRDGPNDGTLEFRTKRTILPRMRICENTHDKKVAGASRARPLRRRLASRILFLGETPDQRTGARRSSHVFTNHDAQQYNYNRTALSAMNIGNSSAARCSALLNGPDAWERRWL